MNIDNIPQDLKQHLYWCVWKKEERKPGEYTKVLYNPDTKGKAQANNRSTFASFDKAAHVLKSANSIYDGLGIGIFDDIAAVDIDHCIMDGVFSDMALDIISTMNSYTEFSPSGEGIRIIFRAPGFNHDKSKYYINYRDIGLEVYIAGCTSKYVTITGETLHNKPIAERSEEIAVVLDRYMQRAGVKKQPSDRMVTPAGACNLLEHEIIAKIKKSKSGSKFSSLMSGDISDYSSHSEADIALCNMLAFWCGGDIDMMDGIFRQSGLIRDKWDTPNSGSTYGRLTLEKAVRDCPRFYDPNNPEYREKRKKKAIDDFQGIVRQGKSMTVINPVETEEAQARYTFDDRGNGYLFADSFKNLCRYCPEAKEWYRYNGKYWEADIGSIKTRELAKHLSIFLYDLISSIADQDIRDKFIGNANSLRRMNKRDAMIKDAQSVYPLYLSELDTNTNLFNCQNGTLHLDTLNFMPHNSDDGLSKISGLEYIPGAKCDRWLAFIDEVMQGDSELGKYIQKIAGYALLGVPSEECLFILYGATTRNGKGTLMTVLTKIFGDYAKTAQPETLASKKTVNSGNASEDLARLRGARLININEPDKQMKFDEAKVKSFTGRDVINCRFLHQNSFEYIPQGVIIINTNYRPAVNDDTLFSSRRLCTVPFKRHFESYEQDKHLKDKLTEPEALSGIFNWILEGLLLYRSEGLLPPKEVIEATNEYRHDSDKIAQFMDECTLEDSEEVVRTSTLYERYQNWCFTNGLHPESSRKFVPELRTKGYSIKERSFFGSGKFNHVIGVRLVPQGISDFEIF